MRWIGYLLGTVLLLVVVVVAALAFMPTGWIVERVERYANESLGLELDIGALDLDIFTTTPGAAVTGVALGDGQGGSILAGTDASVDIDGGRLLRGELVFERVALADAEITLRIDEQGRGNWEALLPEPGPEETPSEGEAPAIPAIRAIDVENVTVDYENLALGQTGEVVISASGSTTDAEQPARLDVEGTLNGVPLDLDAELASPGVIDTTMENLSLDVELVAGDTRATLAGTIGEPRELRDLDIEFGFEAPGVQDLETLSGVSLPSLPPYRLNGSVGRDGEEFVFRRFDGELGDSDFGGDVRVDPSTEPLTLYANVISRTFDLDGLLGAIGGPSGSDGTATDEQEETASAEQQDRRLLPDTELDLRPLVQAFNGAVNYQAREVRSETYPLDSIDVSIEVQGDELNVAPLTLGVGGGEVSASASLDVRPVPAEGTLELQVKRVNLREVMTTIGIDDDSFGQIGGQAKYWMRGDSVASFAAGLDGGLFLLMTGGGLDALLVELASIDLVESALVAITPGKTLTEIDCAYFDLQSRDGLNEIETFVLDTADTVFVADGSIDLAEESFDIAVEPHPKDPSLLEVASGVRVTGTIDDFSVTPGVELGARAAAAAVLASVATPAAALLAFVGTGEAEDTPYCKGLVGSLDDAR